MTDQDTGERLLDLLRQADRIRLPGHRHTADHCLERVDEIRDGIRRLYRDLTGRDPARVAPRVSPTTSMFPQRGRERSGPVPVEHRGRALRRA